MTDKNGVEIKTGAIVEISGAYFKNDNGIYFVDCSPGDPSWTGRDYSLKKISKTGKISTAKHNICFWPISTFVNGWEKRAAANEWNRERATIEVKTIPNMSEVVAHFQTKADDLEQRIRRLIWDFGEESEVVQQHRAIMAHYRNVARATATH